MTKKNSVQKKPTDFETLAFEIYIHLNPDIMKGEVDVKGLDIKRLKKYSTLIHVLNQSFQKVQRYGTIFSDFYPAASTISPHEALEHHMQAYVADLTILRNAITRLIGSLRNDIKRVAKNKQEICSFLDQCRDVTLKRFKNPTDYRDAHSHAETRFLDYDLTRSSSMTAMIKPGNPMLEYLKPGIAERLAKEAEESFQKAKEYWCQTAKKNSAGIAKNMNALFVSLDDCLYRYLGIKPIIRNKLKM